MKVYNIKWTKQLKPVQIILVIFCSIIFAPLTLIAYFPLKRLSNYCKAQNYVPTKISEDYAKKALLIAHRGYRALAPENSLPAYDEAGKAKFWGAENDIHRTKDGVWVLQHDYYTYRMMNKNYHIENTTYDKLCKLYYDNGSNYKNYPDLKIVRLDEYLEKCVKYNMVAVIEIKGKKNTKYLWEVAQMVKKYGVEAIYISFNINAIIEMRKHTDAKLFYLVHKISDKAVNEAKQISNCGISFDGNKKENQQKSAVDKILNANLEAAIWAVDDLKLVEKYIDYTIKYITTNQIHY